jgi:hypothetical protein
MSVADQIETRRGPRIMTFFCIPKIKRWPRKRLRLTRRAA